jgi:cysteine desulfurase/selenocysteine lyase
VKELVQAAKQRGAYVLVDGAQAVGHIQMNVKELGCDFYAFPAHKWLLGPEGLGILYVRKEVLNQVEPLVIGEDALSAYDFTGKFIPNDRSMSKFTPSTQSPALYTGLTAAVEYIQSLGVADIQEKILEGAALLKKALPKVRGVSLLSHVDGEMASGIISFSMKGLEPSEVATGLWQHGRIVGRWVNYPACTRLCVGFFTSDRELNSTFGVLRRVADTAQSEETLEKVRKLF